MLKSFKIRDKAPRLVMLGNSNVGKSTITKYLLMNKSLATGAIGKHAGSTVALKLYKDPKIPYQIVDLPGFGAMTRTSKDTKEKIHDKIIQYVEKDKDQIFLGIVILNILRIEDELEKWYYDNKDTVPLSFEFLIFLKELGIPTLLVLNKIDKIKKSELDRLKEKVTKILEEFGLQVKNINNKEGLIDILEVSAKNRINMSKLKEIVDQLFEEKFAPDTHWRDYVFRNDSEEKKQTRKPKKSTKKSKKKSARNRNNRR